jgi:hypothetical protein
LSALQGFLLHSGSCFVEHAHRSGQGSGDPHVVWNATYRNHLGCLVSSRCVWFVCVSPALTWARSLNVTQVILPVFATTPYFLGTAAHSTHSYFTTYVSISFISAALYHTHRTPNFMESVLLSAISTSLCGAIGR